MYYVIIYCVMSISEFMNMMIFGNIWIMLIID